MGVLRVPVEAAPMLQATALTPAPTEEIIINEVSWGGTIASEDDDWIELYNPNPDNTTFIDISGWRLVSASGSLDIIFDPGTTIQGQSYFLIESRELATSVKANYIPAIPWTLNNSGDIIRLRKPDGSIVDTANGNGGAWPAGGSSPNNASMERYRALPDTDSIWTTYQGTNSGFTDAASNPINGTPGSQNLAASITPPTITTFTNVTPNPAAINSDVTFTISVSSVISTPTGIVSITVQNESEKCIVTLNNGTGNCKIQFATPGTKNITATYFPIAGDVDHPSSQATKTQQVLLLSTTKVESSLPDPSIAYQTVTVSVTVSGNSTTAPTGKVVISGANTSCTITLVTGIGNVGQGSCAVYFYSAGTKTIGAAYSGDTLYIPSNVTQSHVVTVASTATPYVYRTSTPAPLPPPPLVGINEFVPRPGHDWNNDGVINTGDEYIELINHGVVDVNLSGYSLDDEVNVGSAPYPLPAVIIKPGQRMVFYGSQTGIHLDDGGDAVRLNKANGQLVDAYNYTVAKYPDQSYCRLPDNGGLDDWNTDCYPTPGLKNTLNGNVGAVPLLPGSDGAKMVCPIGDNLPFAFALAECPSFGNIWSRFYWDKNGWFGEMIIPNRNSKWDVYVD